ncbi:MAG: signal peptidase II [Clostridia bacterium]|nr:signal peptidase II [Clostridia bacterium]
MFLVSLLAVALLVAVDQITKYLVITNIKPVGSVNAIPGVLNFTYTENTGAAFGILKDSRWVFIVGTISIIIVVLYFMCKKVFVHPIGNIAAVLVVAGGIGNMIDRLSIGYVIDFIDVSPLFEYAVFNFADCCVCVGACLLIVYILFLHDRKKPKTEAADAAAETVREDGSD